LYGDDDTVFFTDAALKLASTMDPNLPYLVTDNLWFSALFEGAWHPHPQVTPQTLEGRGTFQRSKFLELLTQFSSRSEQTRLRFPSYDQHSEIPDLS